MESDKKPPVKEIRVRSVKAVIFERPQANGSTKPDYGVRIEKLYKDKAENAWRSTQYYSQSDLLLVEKVASMAFEWIEWQAQNENEPTPQES